MDVLDELDKIKKTTTETRTYNTQQKLDEYNGLVHTYITEKKEYILSRFRIDGFVSLCIYSGDLLNKYHRSYTIKHGVLSIHISKGTELGCLGNKQYINIRIF
jgi:hypothetical protein